MLPFTYTLLEVYMKFFITVFAIIASFSVSANEAYGTYEDNPTKAFDASTVRHDTVSITWKRVPRSDINSACAAESKKRGFPVSNIQKEACSFWDGLQCTIITGKYTTMHTAGHEFRHCFQGAWH